MAAVLQDWEGNLRREVPIKFTAVAGFLFSALCVMAVLQFQFIEQTANSDLVLPSPLPAPAAGLFPQM